MREMTHSELKNRINQAFDMLHRYDAELIARNASEWAIAHRLAVYIEKIIPGWHVDCEYNRQGPKRDPKKKSTGGKMRPDIIVHQRKLLKPKDNLLVIEMKKRPDDNDQKKAEEYTRPPDGERTFQYQYGLTVSLLDELKLEWYQDGVKLPD